MALDANYINHIHSFNDNVEHPFAVKWTNIQPFATGTGMVAIPTDSSLYLDGTGNWTTPEGGGGSGSDIAQAEDFTITQTTESSGKYTKTVTCQILNIKQSSILQCFTTSPDDIKIVSATTGNAGSCTITFESTAPFTNATVTVICLNSTQQDIDLALTAATQAYANATAAAGSASTATTQAGYASANATAAAGSASNASNTLNTLNNTINTFTSQWVTSTRYEIAVPASGWTGSSAPYTNQVTVSGMTASIELSYVTLNSGSVSDASARLAYQQWDYLETGAGKVTFTALETKPTSDFTIVARALSYVS